MTPCLSFRPFDSCSSCGNGYMLHRRASFMLIPIQTTGQLTAAETVKFYAILVRKSMQYVDRDYSECWEEIRSVMFGVHLPKENSQPLTDWCFWESGRVDPCNSSHPYRLSGELDAPSVEYRSALREINC